MADTIRWTGMGISSGCAVGRTWIIKNRQAVSLVQASVPPVDPEHELRRMETAAAAVEQSLTRLEAQVRADQGEELALIFAAHRMLLQDPAFTGAALERIRRDGLPAEQAVTQVAEETIAVFAALEDEYFRERANDIKSILQQILQALDEAGLDAAFPAEGKYIVIADELTPAQTISLPQDRLLGFIVHKGGKTSHAAILARTYGIPSVIANTVNWDQLQAVSGARIDGDTGLIEVLSAEQAAALALQSEAACPDLSDDREMTGFAGLTLAANIGSPADLLFVKKFKAEGIGLYRTEFLFLGEKLPTEDEQVQAYREVIAGCLPHLTVIRTLDIGGDKQAPALSLPLEQNPFLGVRAIRFCFQRPDIFLTQLRALWRASAAGPLAVMFPLIATLEELRQAKEYLCRAKAEVSAAGYPVGTIQVGIMVEVPSTAILAGQFAREVDFFSIGTNDLIQYTLAADRENNALSDLSQNYQPAVLSLIAGVAAAAKAAGIWIGICGEAGGDTLLTAFFTALGIDELSMVPGQLLKVRQKLRELELTPEFRTALVQNVLACATAAEVKTLLSTV